MADYQTIKKYRDMIDEMHMQGIITPYDVLHRLLSVYVEKENDETRKNKTSLLANNSVTDHEYQKLTHSFLESTDTSVIPLGEFIEKMDERISRLGSMDSKCDYYALWSAYFSSYPRVLEHGDRNDKSENTATQGMTSQLSKCRIAGGLFDKKLTQNVIAHTLEVTPDIFGDYEWADHGNHSKDRFSDIVGYFTVEDAKNAVNYLNRLIYLGEYRAIRDITAKLEKSAQEKICQDIIDNDPSDLLYAVPMLAEMTGNVNDENFKAYLSKYFESFIGFTSPLELARAEQLFSQLSMVQRIKFLDSLLELMANEDFHLPQEKYSIIHFIRDCRPELYGHEIKEIEPVLRKLINNVTSQDFADNQEYYLLLLATYMDFFPNPEIAELIHNIVMPDLILNYLSPNLPYYRKLTNDEIALIPALLPYFSNDQKQQLRDCIDGIAALFSHEEFSKYSHDWLYNLQHITDHFTQSQKKHLQDELEKILDDTESFAKTVPEKKYEAIQLLIRLLPDMALDDRERLKIKILQMTNDFPSKPANNIKGVYTQLIHELERFALQHPEQRSATCTHIMGLQSHISNLPKSCTFMSISAVRRIHQQSEMDSTMSAVLRKLTIIPKAVLKSQGLIK